MTIEGYSRHTAPANAFPSRHGSAPPFTCPYGHASTLNPRVAATVALLLLIVGSFTRDISAKGLRWSGHKPFARRGRVDTGPCSKGRAYPGDLNPSQAVVLERPAARALAPYLPGRCPMYRPEPHPLLLTNQCNPFDLVCCEARSCAFSLRTLNSPRRAFAERLTRSVLPCKDRHTPPVQHLARRSS